MSAKIFSEQFRATFLTCSTSASLSLNQSISSLLIHSSFAFPFWRVFLSVHFSSHHCHGSSAWCSCGSIRQSLTPKIMRVRREDEDLDRQERTDGEQAELRHGNPCVSALFSFAVLALSHPCLCWSYSFAYTSNSFSYSSVKGKEFFGDLRYAPSRYWFCSKWYGFYN